jgi:hypothetical protein
MAKTRAKKNRLLSARQSLRAAVDRACIARGEAQYTSGYRVGAKAGTDDLLYRKERRQYHHCAVAEARVERAVRQLIATAQAKRRA